jgi:hypothetical protein
MPVRRRKEVGKFYLLQGRQKKMYSGIFEVVGYSAARSVACLYSVV